MPKTSTVTAASTGRTVIVCFPAHTENADWFSASELVDDHLGEAGTPARDRFAVRRPRLVGWVTRWLDHHLVEPLRRFGAVLTAAGGRMSRLDLRLTARIAADLGDERWRMWEHHIARTTREAQPWEVFEARHKADPTKLPIEQARIQFEAQPRVVAMLALSAHVTGQHQLDPYELAAFQAGHAAYTAMCWRAALVGDALITAEGTLLQPASQSMADRMRYQHNAAAYLNGMTRGQHLIALAID